VDLNARRKMHVSKLKGIANIVVVVAAIPPEVKLEIRGDCEAHKKSVGVTEQTLI
jgi:hypothetical protein